MMNFWNAFWNGLLATSPLEALAVITGIISVWCAQKASIFTYPIGLINTSLYIWLSLQAHLLGEASVNAYYTFMNGYGWLLWLRRNEQQQPLVHIRYSTKKEIGTQLLFFGIFFTTIWLSLTFLKTAFAPGALPLADAFASATAFTGMWLMTRKKVESWYWWIATNIASIPLYYTKGFVFTSVYYLILLLMAFYGLSAWKKKANS